MGDAALGDGVEEVILALDVPIDGHHSTVEATGEGRHGQRWEAVGICDLEGGLDHPIAS